LLLQSGVLSCKQTAQFHLQQRCPAQYLLQSNVYNKRLSCISSSDAWRGCCYKFAEQCLVLQANSSAASAAALSGTITAAVQFQS
jgi:hypothetical protein